MITRAMLAYELTAILKRNAPVRDGSKYPGSRGASPYPGNLKNNGILLVDTGEEMFVEVGNHYAPYAIYTEKYSRKQGWQHKSGVEFLQRLIAAGGKITNG